MYHCLERAGDEVCFSPHVPQKKHALSEAEFGFAEVHHPREPIIGGKEKGRSTSCLVIHRVWFQIEFPIPSSDNLFLPLSLAFSYSALQLTFAWLTLVSQTWVRTVGSIVDS